MPVSRSDPARHVRSRVRSDVSKDVRGVVGREIAFERAVRPRLTTPAPGTSWATHTRRVLSRARVVLLALIGLFLVWAPMVPGVPGRLVWWVLAVGLVVGLATLGRVSRAGSWPVLLLGVMWATWAATYPWWSSWAPQYRQVSFEATVLLRCGLATMAVVFLAGPSRRGLRRLRMLWCLLVGGLGAMGVVEVLTRRHFSAYGLPYAAPDFSPAGPFGNPNNYACVLVVGIGIALGRLSERISAVHRLVLVLGVIVLAVLVVLTLSRAAIAGVAAVAVAAAILAVSRSVRWSFLLRDRRILAGVALLAVASVAVPALRRINPLWLMLFPGDEATSRSDSLRVTLVRVALEFWSESPWLGIGAARFEFLLSRTRPDVGHVMPVHHTFVEILTEYGVVVMTPLVVLMAATCWAAVRRGRRRGAAGRPRSLDEAGARYLVIVFLLGFVLTGVVTSSALRWPPWWLMLASVVVAAWHLSDRRVTQLKAAQMVASRDGS